jgi:hypothetical protein
MRLVIRTSDPLFAPALLKADIPGLNISYARPRLAMDSTEITSILDVTVISGAVVSVAIELLSKWIYDKLKEKPDQKTVINGNQINFSTTTVAQIIQIISSDNKSKTDKDKPD